MVLANLELVLDKAIVKEGRQSCHINEIEKTKTQGVGIRIKTTYRVR